MTRLLCWLGLHYWEYVIGEESRMFRFCTHLQECRWCGKGRWHRSQKERDEAYDIYKS